MTPATTLDTAPQAAPHAAPQAAADAARPATGPAVLAAQADAREAQLAHARALLHARDWQGYERAMRAIAVRDAFGRLRAWIARPR